MSSWRDEASQQVQDDLDELVDLALRTGQDQLAKEGEFYPFAVSLAAESGETDLVMAEVPDDHDVAEVYERCWQALQSEAESRRAVAVVTNVGDSEGDAIAVALEHRDGPAIEVFLPYVTQPKRNGKKPAQKHKFGNLAAAPGTPRVWP